MATSKTISEQQSVPSYKIPDDEEQCATYCNEKGQLLYVCTRKAISRDVSEFTLHQVNGNKLKKLGKSNSPSASETKYGISPQTLRGSTPI